MVRRTACVLMLGMLGCIEQSLNKADGNLGGDVLIEVLPQSLDFGELGAGDSAAVRTFTVRSLGTSALSVEGMELQGAAAGSYTILSDMSFALPAGEDQNIEVAFEPIGASEQSAVIIVSSNAENSPKAPVDLYGEGLVSELQISPDPLDFGGVGVDCDALENITLTNIGAEALTISAIEGDGSVFDLTTLPTLPLTLEPDEATTVRVTFTPTAEDDFTGSFSVVSTEPLGTRTAEQSGEGVLEGIDVTDEWELPTDPPTDILFSLDSSCSMNTDIWEMYNNFGAFISELENFSEDWQIIVANEDDGCNNSGILKPTTPNYTEKFQNALFAWNTNDDYTEALLTVNHNAIQETDSGECNASFMRPSAMLHIIDITDEPEQSFQITGNDWEYLVDGIIDKKGSAALVTISAIAGDYPKGCDSAAPATGYYEAVDRTGGVFLSICQNWAATSNLGLLASASVNQDRFTLSQPAQESTILVWRNNVGHNNWSYDPSSNTVTLRDPVPTEGDTVRIEYTSTGTCAG
ncbi:MAG: hypothetical protein ACI8S6_001755 [Myxococcota bacterium]|jgi:hypothetical protein